jgi:hypothetical protein
VCLDGLGSRHARCRSWHVTLASRSARVSGKPLSKSPSPLGAGTVFSSLAVWPCSEGVPVAARHRACGTSMATPLRNIPPEETETAKQHPRHDSRLSRAPHWDETPEHRMVDANLARLDPTPWRRQPEKRWEHDETRSNQPDSGSKRPGVSEKHSPRSSRRSAGP